MTGPTATTTPATGTRPPQALAGELRRERFGVADELTCYYDRPVEPANVHVEARVPGELDEAAIRAAVRAVLAAEPGVRVRQAATSRWQRGYYWEFAAEPDEDPVRVASYTDETELGALRSALLSESPPLRVAPPVRFLLASGPGGAAFILNAHHARFDGLACLRLFRAVAEGYTEICGGPEAALSAGAGPVAGFLRPAPASPASAPAALAPTAKAGPGRVTRIVAEPEQGPAAAQAGYGVLEISWDGLAAAKELRASVNDLLITALAITIGEWNQAHGSAPGLVKITMPVGDGAQAGPGGEWANRSRLTAVTVRLSPATTPAGLLDDVASQTSYAKNRHGAQVDLFSRTLAAAPVPVAAKHRLLRLALAVGGPFLCDSCLVSNLGVIEPIQFGTNPASELWFSTSAHMPRGLSLGVVTAGGQLRLTFRYRRALFSDSAAESFAARYRAALDGLTGRELPA
ncbi:MAG TPA: hypothetical protein VFI65_09335 [Streptosporangiaceae bacterium]|nr:hypothetical protein [Streptosporangiaceae bacterium]